METNKRDGKKRKHHSRKNKHVRYGGMVRQIDRDQKWHNFNLKKGMYYGTDEHGYWTSWGDVTDNLDGVKIWRPKNPGKPDDKLVWDMKPEFDGETVEHLIRLRLNSKLANKPVSKDFFLDDKPDVAKIPFAREHQNERNDGYRYRHEDIPASKRAGVEDMVRPAMDMERDTFRGRFDPIPRKLMNKREQDENGHVIHTRHMEMTEADKVETIVTWIKDETTSETVLEVQIG